MVTGIAVLIAHPSIVRSGFTLGGSQVPYEKLYNTGHTSHVSIAVPNVGRYSRFSGVGRHILSLIDEWGQQCQVLEAQFKRSRLPIMRNNPKGIGLPDFAQLVLLPQMTGSQALEHITSIPSMVIVHDIGIVDCLEDRQEMDWVTARMVRNSFRSLRYATRIVVCSEFTAHRLSFRLPEVKERIIVIKSGVPGRFSSAVRESRQPLNLLEKELGQTINRPLLLNVGTERPRKNIKFLMQLIRHMKSKFPNLTLLKIGGAGGDRWRKRTIAEMDRLQLTFGKDVIITDQISDETLLLAYRSADAAIFPSKYEGFGLPAAEALMAGSPVVVAEGNAMEEVVRGFGEVVPLNIDEWAKKLQPICEGAPKKFPTPSYDWSRTAAQYLEAIREEIIRFGMD